MPVIRAEHSKDYTVMSNYHLRDKRLSLKAKGLLSYMLSLPDDWVYTVDGLSACLKESRTAIRTAIQELEINGYIDRAQHRRPNGSITGVTYIIREIPLTAEEGGNLDILLKSENQTSGNPTSENRTLQSTNSTKYNNKNACAHVRVMEFPDFVSDWIQYRAEMGRPYTETGLKKLAEKISSSILVHGEDRLKRLFDDTMANGWPGIIWEKLDQSKDLEDDEYDGIRI